MWWRWWRACDVWWSCGGHATCSGGSYATCGESSGSYALCEMELLEPKLAIVELVGR